MPERNIKNALELLEDIGRQLRRFERTNMKLGSLVVRLYEGEKLVLECYWLALAIEWIAGDVYYNDLTNWKNANKVVVDVY